MKTNFFDIQSLFFNLKENFFLYNNLKNRYKEDLTKIKKERIYYKNESFYFKEKNNKLKNFIRKLKKENFLLKIDVVDLENFINKNKNQKLFMKLDKSSKEKNKLALKRKFKKKIDFEKKMEKEDNIKISEKWYNYKKTSEFRNSLLIMDSNQNKKNGFFIKNKKFECEKKNLNKDKKNYVVWHKKSKSNVLFNPKENYPVSKYQINRLTKKLSYLINV